jgi:hypothetical protein
MKVLLLAGLVCLAFAGRVIALAVFVQFFFNTGQSAIQNAHRANLFQAGGVILGGMVGTAGYCYFFRRSRWEDWRALLYPILCSVAYLSDPHRLWPADVVQAP